ncbi:glycosyltransferase family 4 protein [Methanoculleus receptaculi]|jgi:glycosyltransferase involved in cell wall biosynthesis|uniref:Glycosyltransferase family 4 protein n=1 Tax=Methanoculleus receptaculi TaxID=394967 RepID=A0AAX4FXC4_9EURY|nr:glycosyltransferase family 4 protein [Methanoculleus receptaculi]WOX58514.1 glycosyltransferase family 4 protein [Methanoculleus receptaculi]
MVLSDHYLTFIKDQVELLAKTFAHTDVYVRYHPATEISRIVPYPRLKAFRKESLIDLTNLPENVSIHPISLFYLPCDGQFRRVGDRYYKTVKDLLQKSEAFPDLVHAHFVWPNGFVGAKLKEEYATPFVVTAHGYDIYDLPFRDAEWKEQIEAILNAADAVITVSNSNRKCVERLNVTAPVKVVPNGFRQDQFYPMETEICRRTLNLPIDRKIILSVGNLMEVKGHTYLIDAMSEVVREREDILCLIVGRGELKHKLEKKISSVGLEQYVRLVGGRHHGEIPLWMNACDLFVLPSLRESFGIVQVEAMACGKPVVATRNGGSEEIVIPGKTGLLSDAADPFSLAENIVRALDTSWDTDAIVKYSTVYSWSNVVKEVLRVYNSIRNYSPVEHVTLL